MAQSLHQETNDELLRIRATLEQIEVNQLTKREQIAAMLLQALMVGGGLDSHGYAVKQADKLLNELNKESN